MRTLLRSALFATALLLPLTACKQEVASAPPPPQAISADAIGHYCGMALSDHQGPKGQVILKGRDRPVWMTSVRDLFAFTMLPEEPKDFRAAYVTDLSRAADPAKPDQSAWVEARKAWYVMGSGVTSSMGGSELLPFSEEAGARAYAARNGGTVKRFAEVTEDEILQPPAEAELPPPPDHGAPPAPAGHAGGHAAPHHGAAR